MPPPSWRSLAATTARAGAKLFIAGCAGLFTYYIIAWLSDQFYVTFAKVYETWNMIYPYGGVWLGFGRSGALGAHAGWLCGPARSCSCPCTRACRPAHCLLPARPEGLSQWLPHTSATSCNKQQSCLTSHPLPPSVPRSPVQGPFSGNIRHIPGGHDVAAPAGSCAGHAPAQEHAKWLGYGLGAACSGWRCTGLARLEEAGRPHLTAVMACSACCVHCSLPPQLRTRYMHTS